VTEAIRSEIAKEPLAKIDYVELVDWHTLEPTDTTQGDILVAIAVYIGKTRLIDNFIIERNGD
jgi:pantoate--beta-alanine ligase